MATDLRQFAWDLYSELRKELVSLQTIRSHVIGFKITFVGAGVALIAANLSSLPQQLFLVPGFAAIFFDLLVHSYSYSIKRTGFYCRWHLEPILRQGYSFPGKHPMWEEFMALPDAGKNVSVLGNLGITALAIVPAVVVLLRSSGWTTSLPLLLVLAALFLYDVYALLTPVRFNSLKRAYRSILSPRPAVAVLITRGSSVLLARRAVEPRKGKLDIIGGFVDPGESAEEAAKREVKEETGLELDLGSLRYLGSLPDTYGQTNLATLNLGFSVEIAEGEPKPDSDVKALLWWPIDDPPEEMAFQHQYQMLKWLRDRGESL